MTLTATGRVILRLMLTEPERDDWYGLQIATLLDLSLGTVYPALARLEGQGVLTRRPEEGRTSAGAARFFYSIVPGRLDEVRAALGPVIV